MFNQPFKLRPVVDDPLDADSTDEKEESRVEELKDKLRILVETPMFTVADLNEQQLISKEGRVLLLTHPQAGLMQMYDASFYQMQRNLAVKCF